MDLNHRPLGYEPRAVGNFNNLQDAGGSLEPCKERLGNIIGQLMDRRVFEDFTTTAVVFEARTMTAQTVTIIGFFWSSVTAH